MRTSIVRALRARQIDLITALDANLTGRPDAEHLAYTSTEGRVLFSFNRSDFARLHGEYLQAGREHAGIIISDQLGTSIVIRRLLKLLHTQSAEDMRNWLEYLSNWR